MAESRAFTNALNAVVAFIKNAEQATLALYRISCPSMPIEDPSPASNQRAFEITLDILLSLIESETDVDLAAQRISEKLKSLTSSSVASQESDSSQQATTRSSSESSASSVEPGPTSAATSKAPKSSSTTTALTETIQSQQPPASAQTSTQSPPAEAESIAAVKSKVSRLSSPIAAPADKQHSVSGQSTSSLHSGEAESPAPVQPLVVSPSFTAAAHPGTTQSQQHSAPISAPLSSLTPATGNSIFPNTAQSQQPVTPATAPQSSTAKPSRPLYSANQLTPRPYGLRPTYDPDDGDRLPPEIAKSVGNYQSSSYVVLLELANHGGYSHEPTGSKNGVRSFKTLKYLDYFQTERSMTVQRDIFDDHNGWEIDIPRVSCNQYLDLYNSMIHHKASYLDATCRKILAELEVAIVDRAAVYKWYDSLPATDDRVAYNPRHLAFLQMFEKLEDAINRYLHTGKAQLIRR